MNSKRREKENAPMTKVFSAGSAPKRAISHGNEKESGAGGPFTERDTERPPGEPPAMDRS
jgi:hypothetical protein